MLTLTFIGTIVPTTLPLSFGSFAPVEWQHLDTGVKESYVVKSEGSQITVTVELDVYSSEDIDRHRNRALDLARAAVDTLCFQNGWGFTVSLEFYIPPNGERTLIVPGHPELGRLVYYKDEELSEVYSMLAKEPYLYMAMNDLVTAITVPHIATINCARAIEVIRTMIAPGKRSAGWPAMRAALNLEETFLRPITAISEAPRHGDRVWNPSGPIQDTLERSWTIMSRFIEWKKRGGKKPLPPSDFPMLA